MFLNTTASVTSWNAEGTECSLVCKFVACTPFQASVIHIVFNHRFTVVAFASADQLKRLLVSCENTLDGRRCMDSRVSMSPAGDNS